MTSDLIVQILRMNVAAGAAVLAVLALRGVVRSRIGARAAYGLWLVIPAVMLASFAPPRVVERVISAPRFAPLPMQSMDGPAPVLPAFLGPVASGSSLPDLSTLLAGVWLAGAAVFILMLIFGQRRALARFGKLTPDRRDPSLSRAANPGAGPALVGIVRPRLVVPADFETRFDPSEQAMILAHERTHLAGGDALINAVVAALRALNWFNPLIHLGARRLRVDQELACDAAVVGRFPGERQTYARALLKTQLEPTPIPLGCAWPGGSPNLLRERIEMLAKSSPSPMRLFAGAATVAVLSVSAGLAAWSAQAPQVRTIAAPAPAAGDPLADLSTDVAAVFPEGTDPHILINEQDHGVAGTRSLAVGEVFRDGWRLTFIQPGAVVLSKDGQTRTINLEGRKDQPRAAEPVPAPPATVAASNSVASGSGSAAAGGRSPALQAAVTAGDVSQVLKLGGSAQDALSAMSAKGTTPGAVGADPATAAFVKVGDRYGIAFTGPRGNRQIEVTPDFAGFTPSGEVEAVPAPPIPNPRRTSLISGERVTGGAILVIAPITAPEHRE